MAITDINIPGLNLSQHFDNTQLLKNAVSEGLITNEEYNMMSGYDSTQTMPGVFQTGSSVLNMIPQGLGSLGYNVMQSMAGDQSWSDIPGDVWRNMKGAYELSPRLLEQYNNIIRNSRSNKTSRDRHAVFREQREAEQAAAQAAAAQAAAAQAAAAKAAAITGGAAGASAPTPTPIPIPAPTPAQPVSGPHGGGGGGQGGGGGGQGGGGQGGGGQGGGGGPGQTQGPVGMGSAPRPRPRPRPNPHLAQGGLVSINHITRRL